MREVLEYEDFDAETFPVIVPVDLELLEEKWEGISEDLVVLGTRICLATEVL